MIEYVYTTPKGEPRIRKVRRENPKRFFMYSWTVCGDGVGRWLRGIRDHQVEWSMKALYRLPEVVAALRVDCPVYWCEGEKDADSLAALGFCATSTWQGASSLNWQQADWFTKYHTSSDVLVICDNDAPGGWFGWERYKTLLSMEVGPERVTVIAPPLRLKRVGLINDVTDALDAGLSINDFRVVDLDRLRKHAENYGVQRAARYGVPS